MFPMKKISLVFLGILMCFTSFAHVQLPSIFSEHMVLQQNTNVTIWGWGKPNEVIKITASWAPEKEYSVKVINQSAWSTDIETPEAGGPYQLKLQGYNTIEINDVLIGEVWLGSGQSNMEWTPNAGIDNVEEEQANANFPEIRFFTVPTSTASTPQQLLQGRWVTCTPETMNDFSALMYFFGRELHRNLNKPIGLINSSWGGTPIEVWIQEPIVRGDRWLSENADKLNPVPWGPHEPGKAFNAMINPLIPFKIKGVLWYQGEGNVGFPHQYTRALSTLIDSWRAAWGEEFPFYFVQIAPYAGYGSDNENGAILRDQQRKVLDVVDKTGMAVISDIGDLNDIHPKNKVDVGKRLAYWALNQDYGISDIVFSGPLFALYEIGKSKIIVHFNHTDGGLVGRDGDLREFEILDEAGNWVLAQANIKENVVQVKVGSVKSPRGLRYAYKNDSNPNLFNKAGLPASCFEIIIQ